MLQQRGRHKGKPKWDAISTREQGAATSAMAKFMKIDDEPAETEKFGRQGVQKIEIGGDGGEEVSVAWRYL